MSVSCFPQGTVAAAVAGEVVTLSGHTNNAFNFGADAVAWFFYNSDGTVDQKDNNSANQQVDSGTDWIIPNSAAPGSYRARYSSLTGDTGSRGGNLTTTYAALTANRTISCTDTTPIFGGQSISFTAEIDDGTTQQDTGSYTLSADREDF